MIMGKLTGPRAARDVTRQPAAGTAPPAAPSPAHTPPHQPIRSASVPDSPLAVARTASTSSLPAVDWTTPQPPLDDSSSDGMS